MVCVQLQEMCPEEFSLVPIWKAKANADTRNRMPANRRRGTTGRNPRFSWHLLSPETACEILALARIIVVWDIIPSQSFSDDCQLVVSYTVLFRSFTRHPRYSWQFFRTDPCDFTRCFEADNTSGTISGSTPYFLQRAINFLLFCHNVLVYLINRSS
jgi:hypothetical protein